MLFFTGGDYCTMPLMELLKFTFTHSCGVNIYADSEEKVLEHEENCNMPKSPIVEETPSMSPDDVLKYLVGKQDWQKTFASILLHSGYFHIELNSAKLIFQKILEPLCGTALAEIFGRTSDSRYQHFYSGS